MPENVTDAYILKKTVYKESDYIVTLYTRDFGKISIIARNAKKSIKRFGGRLEPFLELRLKFKTGRGNIKYLEDVNIIKILQNISSDYNRYKWGSFMLEYVDNLSMNEEFNQTFYQLVKDYLGKLDSNYKLSDILRFQYLALKCVGLNPELKDCYKCGSDIKDFGYLSIKKGGIVCKICFGKIKANLPEKPVKFVLNFSDNDYNAIMKNISLLINFTKYHTGREFKSEKFVMENNIQ